MAAENVTGYLLGVTAGADLSAKQFYIVKYDSTQDQVVLSTGATDVNVGVLQNKPASGYEAVVAKEGLCKVLFAGVVAIGDPITSDANGAGVVAAPGAGVNNYIIGRSRVVGAAGDIGEVDMSIETIQG